LNRVFSGFSTAQFFNQCSQVNFVEDKSIARKGFSHQINLVVAVVIAMVFALIYWSAASGSMQEAFDAVFGMATGFGSGGGS
jgi:hypothetical protein